MRLLLLACVLCSLSAACVPSNLPTSPGAVADATTLDEKAGIAATVGYTAASTLGLRLAEAGMIDKTAFKALDAKGYAAVLVIRKAYVAGNSASYVAAIDDVNSVVKDIQALVK